jgi:hypothetical protein
MENCKYHFTAYHIKAIKHMPTNPSKGPQQCITGSMRTEPHQRNVFKIDFLIGMISLLPIKVKLSMYLTH